MSFSSESESDYSFDDQPLLAPQHIDEGEASDFSFDDDHTQKIKPVQLPKVKKGKGDKHVPFESVFIPTADTAIDKLLAWRFGEDESMELLVKYKNSAYYHAEWLAREVIEQATKTGKSRVKKFIESKPLHEIVWSEDDPFNPSFLKVDRIIDQGEMHGELYCLVKWCSQPYDESTWETEELITQIDPDKIDEYMQRNIVPASKSGKGVKSGKVFVRPEASTWKKLDASPVYKNDNQLRSYQLEGLNWLLYCWYHGNNSILADEMGLGKTVQSTAFLYHLHSQLHLPGPFLIITPLSTIGNWEREIRTWTDMNLCVYHGKDTARNLCVESEFYFKDGGGVVEGGVFKFDVVLTTYEMAMSGISQLKPIHWRACILDEAHKLKNKASKISELLKQYHFDHKILLTGTPLQNSLEELYSLLNFLSPNQFSDEKLFQAEYGSLTSSADVEKLQALLKPLMLRRLKEDVEKTIPVKEETIIEVELTTIQKKWYRSILERNFSWLKQGTKKNNVPNLVNTMMELRKCCIHPFLLKGAEDSICDEYKSLTQEQHFKTLVASSGKMVLIDKLLRKLKVGGHKVLLFSQMTRCLDLVQDYLKGMGYGFERIDGGVRGDLRQAAIDRFSAPNSESFGMELKEEKKRLILLVFLLCTRAGGVGINLTVADTVIIFDSDWNPQNDLQAQARCHRIGQTKPVQIYRLVMRNTYEREMLDRASIKLGLDKAVLQRMDAGSTIDPTDTAQPLTNALSKTEIESLLKRGAYHAFIDDDSSTAFCEEDIDQILSRRSQTIRHDNSADKGSIFSKASFTAGASDGIDIHAVDFWEQVARKAQFEIRDEEEEEGLVLNEPRNRRQVQRFGKGGRNFEEEASDDEVVGGEKKTTKLGPDDPKVWTITEKTRFDRNLMLFGLGGIDQGVAAFPRRSVEDMRAVSRLTIGICLNAPTPVESDVVADITAMLALEQARLQALFPGAMLDPALPYPTANAKEIAEYRSFLDTASATENIQRKSKNLLARFQMLHTIRMKISPNPFTVIPYIPSSCWWWSASEDRDLLIGILKHGYGQYEKIRFDPELCFYKRFVDEDGVMRVEHGSEGLEGHDIGGELKSEGGEVKSEGGELKSEVGELKIDAMEVDVMRTGDTPDEMQVDTPQQQATTLDQHSTSQQQATSLDQHPAPLSKSPSSDHITSTLPQWPTASEHGIRVRKLIAAFNRLAYAQSHPTTDRSRTKVLKDIEKQKVRERDLGRKDKIEFMRVLMSFGVEHTTATDSTVADPTATEPTSPQPVRGDTEKIVWTRFKELAGLTKKPDDTLNEYFAKMFNLAVECVESGDYFQKEIKEHDTRLANGQDSSLVYPLHPLKSRDDHSKDESANGTSASASVAGSSAVLDPTAEPTTHHDTNTDKDKSYLKFNAYTYKLENDGDILAYEKAKRLLKRVEQMRTLRERVLVHPEIDERLATMGKFQRTVLPDWWQLKYDKWFLYAISSWGVGRSDLYLMDPNLPFKKLHREFEKLTTTGEDADRFWMKETVAIKRFEMCCEAVLNVFHVSGQQPEREEAPKLNLMSTRSQRAATQGDESDEQNGITSTNATPKRLKIKLTVADESEMVEYAPKKRKRKEQPDMGDMNVTLEELFAFNKKLSGLYGKKWQEFKVGAVAGLREQGRLSRRDEKRDVVIEEYSEGSDGECVVSKQN